MKIGITERGDAGLDLSWVDKLTNVDGAIIITKRLTDACIKALLDIKDKVIPHCGCTGLGGTIYEPNVPTYRWQLGQLIKLLESGFDLGHVVLRIDPIIPYSHCLLALEHLLSSIQENSLLAQIKRIRVSIVDMYPHVRQRFKDASLSLPYGEYFTPNADNVDSVVSVLSKFPYEYETCAEPILASKTGFTPRGCVSLADLDILELPSNEGYNLNPQGRKGCLCLGCKVELLSNKNRCANQCVYCYWKD